MKSNRGYILLEALVGVAILSIVIVAALQSVAAGLAAVEEIKKQSIAVTLAQKEMEQLGGRDAFKASESGDFGADWPGYSWSQQSAVVQRTNFYSLINIKLSVAYTSRRADRSMNLESLFITRMPAVQNWN